MYGCHFFAAVLLFNGWNSAVKDLRKHSKRKSAISCTEATIKRTSLRLSYSQNSRRRNICFTESSSKFRATFFARILALLWFALSNWFMEQISSEHSGILAWPTGNSREKSICESSREFFSFRTVQFVPTNSCFCFSFSEVVPEHESSLTLFLRLVSVHLTKLIHSGSLQAWKQIKGR